MPFVKVDIRILDSSIWAEDSDTRIVWLTLLTMADAEGKVASTAPGISHRARVPIEVTRSALEILEAPDPDSKSQDNEGRRVQRIDGGYLILNFKKYRARDYSMSQEAVRKREWRGKGKVAERAIRRDIVPPLSGHSASASDSASVSESGSKTRKGKSEYSTWATLGAHDPEREAESEAQAAHELEVKSEIEQKTDSQQLDNLKKSRKQLRPDDERIKHHDRVIKLLENKLQSE